MGWKNWGVQTWILQVSKKLLQVISLSGPTFHIDVRVRSTVGVELYVLNELLAQ